MTGRQQPLTVEVEDDRLVISIGIDALATAVTGADFWDEDTMRIRDRDELARDIVRELEDEQDDGTTPVHLMIDAAAEAAVDNGSTAISVAGEDLDDD